MREGFYPCLVLYPSAFEIIVLTGVYALKNKVFLTRGDLSSAVAFHIESFYIFTSTRIIDPVEGIHNRFLMYDFIESDVDYIEPVVKLRGFIINKTISIEELMDTIIVWHYHRGDNEKAIEFHDDVLKYTFWNRKINLLRSVLSRYDTAVLNKKNKCALFDSLDAIAKQRNRVAHHIWTSVWEDGVYTRKEKSKEEFHLSEEVVQKFIDDSKIAIILMTRIIADLGYFPHIEVEEVPLK